MLLIPLDAADSDLPSLPAPFSFYRQLMVVVLVRCAGFRNISHYFLNQALIQYLSQYVITIPYL